MNISNAPKFLRIILPTWAKRLGVRMYVKWLMRKGPRDFDTPRLNFANILPPEGGPVRSGKVKLTYLRKRWGEYKNDFNILYTVSSVLPAYPDIWVKEAKQKGYKYICNQNGIGVPAWAPDTWEKINRDMSVLQFADFVAYQSEFAKREADDLVAKASGPWDIIVNSCEVDRFTPAEVPPPLKPFRILVMGTAMTPEKVMIPLEALKILTERGFDAELRSYGPLEWPNGEEEIATKAKEWGLADKLKRRGRYPHAEAPELFREGHVFIHSKHMDSSPNVLPEAMASGLPVIGGSTGGTAEWIGTKGGIVIPVTYSREKFYYPTPEAVADAIMEIAKDWPTWSKSAREHAVDVFSTERFLRLHAEAFKKIGIKNVD